MKWSGESGEVSRAVRGAGNILESKLESKAAGGGARATCPVPQLFGEEVVEGLYGGEFVVLDVEDGVELGDVEDVLDFLGEVEEFEFAAGVADGGEAADEFSDAGAVDVVDADQIEDDFLLALGDEVADSVAEVVDFVTEYDAAGHIEDGDVGDFAGFDG